MTLTTLWQSVLQNATDDDIVALHHLLIGMQEKQQGIHSRYINASLRMTGEFFSTYSIVQMPNSPIIQNTIKAPHGGMLATLADAAMGGLASRAAPNNKNVVTTSLTINFIATTTDDTLLATGHFEHKGNRSFVMSCRLTDSTGKLLATASAHFLTITKRS